jgi:hypothetical protein
MALVRTRKLMKKGREWRIISSKKNQHLPNQLNEVRVGKKREGGKKRIPVSVQYTRSKMKWTDEVRREMSFVAATITNSRGFPLIESWLFERN